MKLKVCGKAVEAGSLERCRYAKGHAKPCWRYLSVTGRKGYVPGTPHWDATDKKEPTR